MSPEQQTRRQGPFLSTGRHALFVSATFILALVLPEIVLRSVTWLVPAAGQMLVPTPLTIPDPDLGIRPNPAAPDHDRRGWRNQVAIDRASLVALGDSQTYGSGVRREEAWPLVLNRRIGGVYNMALGNYGPAHGLLLWKEATALKPKIVIEALYSGNDLYDCFKLVYMRGLLQELKSRSPSVQKHIREAEEREPIHKRINTILQTTPPTLAYRVKTELRRKVRIYALLREVREVALRHLNIERELPAGPIDEVFKEGALRTVFQSEYRLVALNLDDPRIAEGHRIALGSIVRMKALSEQNGIRFVVLLIPTKESVFRKLHKTPSDQYRTLVEQEARFFESTRLALKLARIEYIDALPKLRAALGAGVNPYSSSDDGHPNAEGHRVIAESIVDYFKRHPAR